LDAANLSRIAGMPGPGEFEGAVALVTGAAGAVGHHVVRRLREGGASVVAEDIDPRVEELAGDDPDIAPLVADITSAGAAPAAVGLALERFGRLDVLVNNAARFLLKPTLETTADEWDGLMAVNVRGMFLHCREALPHMLERGSGAIVNMASISGLVGLPDQLAYCATKGAIVQLTRALAVECAPRGVRVNALAPGAIDTPFLRNALAGAPDPDAIVANIAASHPLKRVSSPEEIAELVVFLASPRAAFVAGAVLAADGGFTAQ